MAQILSASRFLAAAFLVLAMILSAPAAGILAPSALASQVDDATPEATPDSSGPVFVVYPAGGMDGEYFTVEAEPGTTSELTVVLGNADDEPLSLLTYVNDAIPATNGGFAIAEPEAPATGTATWIDYPQEIFEFGPGEGIERTITVTIPDDAEPGQYIAGLALQTAEPLEVENSTFFNQIIRKTVAIFIIVPGEQRPEFSLGAPEVVVTNVRSHIMIPVENTGNVLVRPQGELTLENEDGEVVMTAPVRMGSVYAGTITPLAVQIPSSVPVGEYSLAVDLTDEETGVSVSSRDAMVTVAGADERIARFTMTGTVTLAPDAQSPAFADVAAEITNAGESVENAEIVLDVTRDGEVVESYPLVPTLSVPQGTTTNVSQRYVPLTGWEPGRWSFVLRLNIIDPATGVATTVATVDTIPAITIGE